MNGLKAVLALAAVGASAYAVIVAIFLEPAPAPPTGPGGVPIAVEAGPPVVDLGGDTGFGGLPPIGAGIPGRGPEPAAPRVALQPETDFPPSQVPAPNRMPVPGLGAPGSVPGGLDVPGFDPSQAEPLPPTSPGSAFPGTSNGPGSAFPGTSAAPGSAFPAVPSSIPGATANAPGSAFSPPGGAFPGSISPSGPADSAEPPAAPERMTFPVPSGPRPLDREAASAPLPTEPEPATPSPSAKNPEADLEAAAKALEAGELKSALEHYSAAYDWTSADAIPPEAAEELYARLDQLAGSVVYSREPWLGEYVTVKPQETLETIAADQRVPWRLLGKINGIAYPDQVQTGDKIKTVPGPFKAILDLQRRRITLRIGNLYAGRFPVELAAGVPAGVYEVQAKREPAATGAGSEPSLFRIELGRGKYLYGPGDAQAAVPAPSADGIRLSARDIEDVFDILSIGSQVEIVGTVGNAGVPATADRR